MRLCYRRRLAAIVACSAFGVAATCLAVEADPQRSSVALSPHESLSKIRVDPGLKVELVACEPNVIDPVAVRFDEDGRMWVVQMRDYPTGPTKEFPARSRVSVLTDKDGDGFYETATVFADNLPFATGVQPWKGGAFVTMAGKVVYLKDTNGDGKADEEDTWYTGFAEKNQQLRANHPRFALDNHIYIANGLRGGAIIDTNDPNATRISISGMDFRFDPRAKEKYEAVSGMGQFGLTFDDYGNRFECSNRNPAYQIVLDDWMLKKNPLVSVPGAVEDVAKPAEESRLYSIGRTWTTSNLHAGQFTAACGVDVYRGDALPSEYYGNIFTCDPTARVVHREIMKPNGVAFVSNRLPEHSEFFASGDEWCCPVNLDVGPDGAFYVTDMYRQVIEHPHWMPEELQKRRNLRAGNDRGRIFRVVPKDFHRPKTPAFSKMSSEQLVDELASPNSWKRETAQRLLVERGDKSVVPQLHEMALHGKTPLARIHALRLLDAFDQLDETLLLRLVDDPNPRIVEQAIQVSEPKIEDWPQLQKKITELTQDKDARVRFQALVVAMPVPSAPKHPTDQWERDAMLIAARHRSGDVLAKMLSDPASLQANIPDPKQFIIDLVRQSAGSKDAHEYLPALRALVGNRDYERVGLAGFLGDMAASGVSLDYVRFKLGDDMNRRLDKCFDDARRDAQNPKLPKFVRCESIDLLAFVRNAAETLTRLATDDPNQEIRLRAIGALAKEHDFQPWKELLVRLDAASPVEQRAILDGLFAREERTLLLLDEIESGKIKPTLVDPIHAKMLLEHRDAAIKLRSQKVLASIVPADRAKMLAQYEPALKLIAEPARGQLVFTKHCSICHKIGNIGVSFAPDISDSRERSPLQILTDVIQPNRAIDSNYYSYTAITTDGHVHTGVLASETSTSITLKMQEGKSETIRRNEIDELHNNGVSFMPEGLEKDIPPQDMADLISFIKNWRYLDNAQQQEPEAKPQAGR